MTLGFLAGCLGNQGRNSPHRGHSRSGLQGNKTFELQSTRDLVLSLDESSASRTASGI
jgi:hypothetical protein